MQRSISLSSPPNFSQYAQKISVSEKMLMHMPESLSFEVAAGIPEASLSELKFPVPPNRDRRHTSLQFKPFILSRIFNLAKAFSSTLELLASVKL